jgi:polyhydroxyalkanoate synthesis regulator phasin
MLRVGCGDIGQRKTLEALMFETLDKLMMAGMGAMSMTKEKAEKIFDEAVKKGMAEKEHKSGFVKEMLDSADKARADLEKLVSEQIHKTLSQMPLATKDDIKRVEQKLDQILSRQ